MSNEILITQSGSHAILTLNRPEKRNPLPYRPADGFLAALQALGQQPAVRAVVIAGTGKAFCSGLDLDALQALQGATPEQNRADSEEIRDFFESLRRFPKPLIAAVNGPAVAGGAGLLLACDVVVMAESAHLRFSEVAIGFVPALVAVYLRRQVGQALARRMLLTARKITARELQGLGLVDEVVPEKEVLGRAAERAQEFAALSPEALRRTKALLLQLEDLPLQAALERATAANAEARATAECQEGIRAFLEKREPRWGLPGPVPVLPGGEKGPCP